MKRKEYLMTENVGSICIHDLEMDSVCDFWKDVEDRSDPFRLSEIALDAFNTANKCGLLPSELLRQMDELLSALTELWSHVKLNNEKAWNGEYDKLSIFGKVNSCLDTIHQIEQ